MGLLKSVLLGSKLRILLTVALSLGVVVAGGFSLGLLGAPSVAGVQNSFGTVTDETTEIRTDLVVNNPNPIGVNLGDVTVSYDVLMNDVKMANGTKKGVSVGAGNSTLEFTTDMRNDRIPAWWVSHVRNDEQTSVRVDAQVRSGTLGRTFDAPPVERQVETDVISQFNSSEPRPVNADQPFVSDPVAYVNETSAQWGEVTKSKTPIDMRFVVYNAKTTPLVISEIGYTISMNDVTVGEGTSDREHLVQGHSTETIETQTVIENGKLDDWWVSHLENDQVTELRIDFYAKVELGGQTFQVPLEQLTYEKTIETDVFGSKDDSGAGNADSGSDAETTSSDENGGESGDETGDQTTSGDQTQTTSGGETSTPGETTSTGSGGTTTTDDGILALGAPDLR